MASKMSRPSLRLFYVKAMADEDPVTAQFYFQKMQEYDTALKLFGKDAARDTLPPLKVKRKSGRIDLNAKYLDALKAGDTEKATRLAKRIAARDKSGLKDSKKSPVEPIVTEFWQTLGALR